jgi:SAM-dependent methyltransferase
MSTTPPISNSKESAWFDERPKDGQLPEESLRLLESYSGIPPEDILEHVTKIRDEAWEVYPYPCIGQWRFLDNGITDCEEYGEVLKRLRRGEKLLDVACCFGQTVRQLVANGAPSENIYGSDLESGFIELGYKLFKDRDKLQSKFLVADIFNPASSLNDIKGKVDIVYAGSFFHLWGLEKQKEVSKAVANLLRPQPGSMIIGRQVGAITAVERSSATGSMFRHNVESFQELWKEIGDDLGVTFTVTATLKELGSHFFEKGDTRRLWFCVRRQ